MQQSKRKLAIVIPAYKISFLEETLDSIAKQTCKDFTLYIGNDNSPYDLYSVISKYESQINLVYKHFPDNLGSINLVNQWERCIDLIQDEEWIWLFSDDDIMDNRCVEEFYNMINEDRKALLLHFNVKQIDEYSTIIKELPTFPEKISSKEYLDSKLKGELYSYVIEFIFNRKLFESNGKFTNFDLAWGSDFITWLKLCESCKHITTIPNIYIKWRISKENISPNKTNSIIVRKMISHIENIVWIKEFIERNNYRYSFFYYKSFFGEMIRQKKSLNTSDIKLLTRYFRKKTKISLSPRLFYIFWKITNKAF